LGHGSLGCKIKIDLKTARFQKWGFVISAVVKLFYVQLAYEGTKTIV
jgi:hypothetical protein